MATHRRAFIDPPRKSLKTMQRGFVQESGVLQFSLSIAATAVLGACALLDPSANPLDRLKDLVHLGGSLVEMKTVADVKDSFVLRASYLLFSDDLTPSPDQVPKLTPAQLWWTAMACYWWTSASYKASGQNLGS